MKNLFDDFLCALEILFALQNYGCSFHNHNDSFHNNDGIMGHIFSDIFGIMGPNF